MKSKILWLLQRDKTIEQKNFQDCDSQRNNLHFKKLTFVESTLKVLCSGTIEWRRSSFKLKSSPDGSLTDAFIC